MSITVTIAGVGYEIPSSAADTNWSALQIAFEQALVAALATPTWTSVSAFTNSWQNSATGQVAQYWKDSQGTVHLRGTIRTGTLGQSAFTLPAGYRPTHVVTVLGATSGGMNQINVATDGTVIIGADLGAGNPQTGTAFWFSFSTVA